MINAFTQSLTVHMYPPFSSSCLCSFNYLTLFSSFLPTLSPLVSQTLLAVFKSSIPSCYSRLATPVFRIPLSYLKYNVPPSHKHSHNLSQHVITKCFLLVVLCRMFLVYNPPLPALCSLLLLGLTILFRDSPVSKPLAGFTFQQRLAS